jgi:hypothetical protein
MAMSRSDDTQDGSDGRPPTRAATDAAMSPTTVHDTVMALERWLSESTTWMTFAGGSPKMP